MKFLRALLILLGIVVACVALAIAFLCTSTVQTWIARAKLAKVPGIHATVEGVSVGFSEIHAVNLRIERDGVVLTVPDVDLHLPVKTALRDHRLLVSSLVAKGWTLDLSQRLGLAGNDVPPAGTTGSVQSGAAAVPAEARGEGTLPTTSQTAAEGGRGPGQTQAATAFQGLLRGVELPYDGTIDGVQIEGDVLLATPKYSDPSGVHIGLKGDGLTAGHATTFAVDAIATIANTSAPSIAAHGTLTVDVAANRAIDTVDFKGTLSPLGTSEVLDFTAQVAKVGDAGNERYAVNVRRSDQRYARATGEFQPGHPRLEGEWKIDFGEAELNAWVPDAFVHLTSVVGSGKFDADPRFTVLHANGRLSASGTRLAILAPPPAGPNAVALTADFDATRSRGVVRIDRLRVGIDQMQREDAASVDSEGNAPLTLSLLKPFTIDEATHDVKGMRADAPWLRVAARHFSLRWMPSFSEQLRFTDGAVTADVSVQGVEGAYQLRSKTPLLADNVTLEQSGRIFAQHIDVSMPVAVDRVPGQGWIAKAAPLTVGHGGHRLFSIDGTLPLHPDPYGRMQASGAITADLDAIAAAHGAVAGLDWLKGKSATGTFSAELGAGSDITAKLTVVGHDPQHSITADLSASIDDYRTAKFHAPLAIATGATTAKIEVEGMWTGEPAGQHIEMQVGGEKIGLEQAKLLAGVFMPGELNAAPNAPRDARPFWGDLIGRVRVDFREVDVGDREWDNVGATIAFDHTSILLNGVRGVFNPISAQKVDRRHAEEKEVDPRSALTGDATITFDPAAAAPYSLTGKGAMEDMNATRLFGTPPADENPEVEGRFSVAATLSGSGKNLADLAANQRAALKLTSTAGIVRLLKANVGEAIPEEKSRPGSDAAAGVGYAFGAILGVHPDPKNNAKVSPVMESILNATYDVAEIGYDQFTVTATRRADGTIELSDLTIVAKNTHLSGSGAIAPGAGSIAMRPLTLDLRLGFKGITADRLNQAHVLSAEKNAQGYTLMPQLLHFGGTLNRIDNTAWQNLLVKAAEGK